MLAILELNPKGLHQSSGKEKESCCLLFPSSTKREIRHFHVVVVQRRQRNVQKSVMHVQSCCFACLNLLLFCRFRCRRRPRCVNSVITTMAISMRTKHLEVWRIKARVALQTRRVLYSTRQLRTLTREPFVKKTFLRVSDHNKSKTISQRGSELFIHSKAINSN